MAERVRWSAEQLRQFSIWLDDEIRQAKSARSPLEQQWLDWLEQYRAPAKQPLKRYPFEGASNIVLPVTATDVDQLFAKFVKTIHAPPNLWTLDPLNDTWWEAAKPLQDFLQWLDRHVLKMEDVDERAFLEMVKLGTCIYKTHWHYERRIVSTYDESGKIVKAERITSKPVVDHVRLWDFLIPPYAYAIEPDAQGGAPWVAERHRVDQRTLDTLADSSEPYLPNFGREAVAKVRTWLEASQTEYDQAVQDQDLNKVARLGNSSNFDLDPATRPTRTTNATAHWRQEIELWEVHARWATSASDSPSDVVVWWHQPTQTILRATYRVDAHGKRPYDVARYFPGEGFYGIGVCEQDEMPQQVLSDLTNFTHDNVHLGNSIMLGAKAGANIAPGEPIYPGKVLITDGDPRAELLPIQLGTTRADLPNLIGFFQAWGEKRTGIGDVQRGNINSLPGRTPATTMQSLLEEGAKRPDLTLASIRRALGNVGLKVIQLLQQHCGQPQLGTDGQRWLQIAVDTLGVEPGSKVVEKLVLPMENAEYGVGVGLTATSASANKEVAQQRVLAQIQTAGPVYNQMLQFLMMYLQTYQVAPQVAQVALDSAQGLAELFKQYLAQSDNRRPDALVPAVPQDPDPTGLAGLAMGMFGGAGGGVAPPAGEAGMAAFPPALGGGGPDGV